MGDAHLVWADEYVARDLGWASLTSPAPETPQIQQAQQATAGQQQGQPSQQTLVAQEDPDIVGIPNNVKNDNDELDPNAEAERAMEPVEPEPVVPPSPTQAVLNQHSASDIQAVRNGACSVDPQLEEAIRINDTFDRIKRGGPFPYKQDGEVFENRPDKASGIRPLPVQPKGYYHEYTVEPLSGTTRGTLRIVTGSKGEVYYTDSHYVPGSFVQIAGPR